MTNDVLRPERIEWATCNCGSATCHRQHPTNLGMFYQGSGFDPHEVEWLNRAWAAESALFRIIDIAEGDGTARAQPRISEIARRAIGVPLQ
jgi:hypothetical protein